MKNMNSISANEWWVLDKVFDLVKNDVWFYLKHNNDENTDYIFDMVEEKNISMKDGIGIVDGLMTFEAYDSLRDHEKKIYNKLVERFGIREDCEAVGV